MERNAPLLTVATHRRDGSTNDGSTNIDCETAFRCIVEDCVHAIQRHRTAAANGDADAVHEMRIELTRLDSALLFFWPVLTNRGWRRMESRVRWLNTRLGKARDQDVLLQYSRRRRYRRWARRGVPTIERARAKSYRKLATHLHSGRYQRLLRDIEQQASQPRHRSSGESRSIDVATFAEARLLEWRHEIERTGRHLEALGRKQQHRLRLKCKHYRYVVDSLLELGVGFALQDLLFRDVARQVHALLGDLRDLRRFKNTGRRRPPRYRAKTQKLLERAATAFRGHH